MVEPIGAARTAAWTPRPGPDGLRPRVALVAGGPESCGERSDHLSPTLTAASAAVGLGIGQLGAEVVDFGFVSNAADGMAIADRIRAARVDLIVVFVSTRMTSAQVLPIFRGGDAPVLLLCMQPGPGMDEHVGAGDQLAYAGIAALPEMCAALERLGRPARTVTGHLGDVRAWSKVDRYIRAARVVVTLREARFGLLGRAPAGTSDITSNIAAGHPWGGRAELLAYEDLRRFFDEVGPEQVECKLAEVRRRFSVDPETDDADLRFHARMAVALDALVAENGLDTLSCLLAADSEEFDGGLASGFPIGASLLTSRGVPMATGSGLPAAVAMRITGVLGGGGTLTEGQSLDFDRGHVELGHNGAVDARTTENTPRLRAATTCPGAVGARLASVEAAIRPGPVTQLALAERGNGRMRFIASEGIAIPGPMTPIGTTATRVDFGADPGDWVDAWSQSASSRHWSMAVGHLAQDIETVAELLGAEYVLVQPT